MKENLIILVIINIYASGGTNISREHLCPIALPTFYITSFDLCLLFYFNLFIKAKNLYSTLFTIHISPRLFTQLLNTFLDK
jgi:hypothetical protein